MTLPLSVRGGPRAPDEVLGAAADNVCHTDHRRRERFRLDADERVAHRFKARNRARLRAERLLGLQQTFCTNPFSRIFLALLELGATSENQFGEFNSICALQSALSDSQARESTCLFRNGNFRGETLDR